MHLLDREREELNALFTDVINYESEDPCEPIDPLTYTAPDGDTCLHIAIWRDDLRAVHLLIKAGVDLNRQGDMGETPLHIAVKKGNRPIIKKLLMAGAKTDIRSDFDKTAREAAAAQGFHIDLKTGDFNDTTRRTS